MFARNGVIGKSGKFYPCKAMDHIQTMLANMDDVPFVQCKRGEFVIFDAYYTDPPRALSTTEQFETTMEWCAFVGEKFESVTDCWDAPWSQWRDAA